MTLPPIHICNRSRAARIKRRGWSGVITLADPGQRDVLAFHKWPHPEHLVVRCEDLDYETPGFITPTEEHVQRIIDFGRNHVDGGILIHCNAGISRSSATALTILADRLGPGKEQDALDQMLFMQPEAVPNILIVMHADMLLGRDGSLIYAMVKWDSPRAWNQWRREANRIATLFGNSVPLPPMPSHSTADRRYRPNLEDLQRESRLLDIHKTPRPDIPFKMGWYDRSQR